MASASGAFGGTQGRIYTDQLRVSTESMGPVMRVSTWSLVGMAFIFLGLRIYCKILKHRGLWWDDYVLLAAWVGVVTGPRLE